MIHPHSLVAIVTVLALIVVMATQVRVGRARYKFGVTAPAVTGHEMFERHYRVQMNTVEQIVVFLPALWLCAIYWQYQYVVALIGLIWVIGRVIYMIAYARDPKARSLGFGLTTLPTMVLVVGALIGAIRTFLAAGA